jgi:hypothetical protein
VGERPLGNSQSPRHRFFFADYASDRDISSVDTSEEEDDGRTEIIYARTEFGHMMDFLKENPSVTKEAYMWEWTVPQLKLASMDRTRVKYLTEKEVEAKKSKQYSSNNIDELKSDLGIPIFGFGDN